MLLPMTLVALLLVATLLATSPAAAGKKFPEGFKCRVAKSE